MNADTNNENSGLGWRWVPEESTLHFLFEIDGAASDDEGECPAGIDMKIGPLAEKPARDKVEATVEKLRANGIDIPGFGIAKGRPVTWDDYQAAGYDED